ncbi:MAG: conjugal transfer protein TraX [Clostridiales bacterium]|nr:conjugal transfer protein TraX [Clostridiales bacterium]
MNNRSLAVHSNGKLDTKRKGISGSTLKLIAIITMLIDHIAAVVLEKIIIRSGGYTNIFTSAFRDGDTLSIVYLLMRAIGRIAFPIFCFLLVEGFLHTRNVWKYAFRLAVFALLSEIPFDLALHAEVFYFGYQNVFFTLLIGLLVLIGIKAVSEKLDKSNIVLSTIAQIIVVVVGIAVAELLKTDYSGLGVITMVAMYLLRKNKVISMLGGCVVLSMLNFFEIVAFLDLIPVWLYNGKRGLKLKYVFYIFYPAHLFILYLVCYFMGIL